MSGFIKDFTDCTEMKAKDAFKRAQKFVTDYETHPDDSILHVMQNAKSALIESYDSPVSSLSIKDRSILMSCLNEVNLFQIAQLESAEVFLQTESSKSQDVDTLFSDYQQCLQAGHDEMRCKLVLSQKLSRKTVHRPGKGLVILFEHKDFNNGRSGRNLVLSVGRHPHLARWNFDNILTSFVLGEGTNMTIFSQMNFQGDSNDYAHRPGGRADISSDLPIGNDRASSVIVY